MRHNVVHGEPRQFRPTAHLGSEGQGARCLGDIALGLEQCALDGARCSPPKLLL